jgi:hypothetical protein
MKNLAATLLLGLALLVAPACGGKGGPDKLDTAALKEGASASAKLKFWTLERGMYKGNLVDNVHFDDGGNPRVVFVYDAAMKDKLAVLKQGAVVAVTFTYEPGDAMVKGVLTAVN